MPFLPTTSFSRISPRVRRVATRHRRGARSARSSAPAPQNTKGNLHPSQVPLSFAGTAARPIERRASCLGRRIARPSPRVNEYFQPAMNPLGFKRYIGRAIIDDFHIWANGPSRHRVSSGFLRRTRIASPKARLACRCSSSPLDFSRGLETQLSVCHDRRRGFLREGFPEIPH